jgi:hypothetical protein
LSIELHATSCKSAPAADATSTNVLMWLLAGWQTQRCSLGVFAETQDPG